MVLSVSALVLFGVILFMLIRNKQLKTGHAILAALFGFMLSQSTAAEPINNFLTEIGKTLTDIAS